MQGFKNYECTMQSLLAMCCWEETMENADPSGKMVNYSYGFR